MAENLGVNPPDFTTLAGKVRILVGDTTPDPLVPDVPGYGEYAWYSDAELEALGDLMGSNPKRVAVWVLSQVMISEALLLKKWKTDDLQVDGPALIAAMEKTVARLSKEIETEAAQGDELFLIVGGTDCRCRGEGSTWPVGCTCGRLF